MVGEFDRRKEKWKTEMEREREKREGKLRERGGLGTGVTWAGPKINREFPSLRSPVKPVFRPRPAVLRFLLTKGSSNVCSKEVLRGERKE